MNQGKTFRLFISSTFSDFSVERRLLQEYVFPEIKKYCNESNLNFQPIDLRWGVSNEAQLDQKTLELCLEEVRESKINHRFLTPNRQSRHNKSNGQINYGGSSIKYRR